MQKFTFGTPEELIPSKYCAGFCYTPTESLWRNENFSFKKTKTGCVIEWEIEPDTQIFGFGLQLKRFNQTGNKVTTRSNADPTSPNGESHAPVPFLVTNKGYGIYFDTARYAEFYCGRPRRTAAKADISSSVMTSPVISSVWSPAGRPMPTPVPMYGIRNVSQILRNLSEN